MVSETIAACMALRAWHGWAAKAFDFFVVLLSMFKSSRSEHYSQKYITRVFFFVEVKMCMK